MKKILVTGAAGFIGFHYAKALAEAGYDVFGCDNLNDYYDVSLKEARLKQLEPYKNFRFEKAELSSEAEMRPIFTGFKPDVVAHLGAQAGVRYSIKNPMAYIKSNIDGFGIVLEGCRHNNVKHLIFASSSSVYGSNTKLPFSVSDNVDHPISLYAATKKANELMAHSYAHLYKLPCTGLRFFTVYGPWGRPDMAMFSFTKALYEGKAIDVYNNGEMQRDFTYIDDVVMSLVKLVDRVPKDNYKLYNIGNSKPEKLLDMIAMLEAATGKKANKNMLPMQAGDVYATYADVVELERDVGFRPDTPLNKGIAKFVEWYKNYYGI